MNCFLWLFLLQALAVLLLAVTSMLLVPTYGLFGAASSIATVSLVMVPVQYAAAAYVIPRLFDEHAVMRNNDLVAINLELSTAVDSPDVVRRCA
jgi:O-antigen/teichoic acid export membrane protein